MAIADIQSQTSKIELSIQKVGIKGFKQAITFSDIGAQNTPQNTVACFDLYVSLAADQRGTHMSRFIETAMLYRDLSLATIVEFAKKIKDNLDAPSSHVAISFDYFIEKKAPISKISAPMDYPITIEATVASDGSHKLLLIIGIPVTSLCPCSKKISEYGAHNQRSLITVTLSLNDSLAIHELIASAEKLASSELFGVLKREDEKYVTEYAYDNPMFVEDMVRVLAQTVRNESKVSDYTIESENFESIHNHNAYALITSKQ